MDVGGILQAVAGGLVGGALAPFLTHEREKRRARGEVRRWLAEVERFRWARADHSPEGDALFVESLSQFEVQAVSAGLPRKAVDLYVVLSEVCYVTTRRSLGTYEQPSGPREGRVISPELGVLVGTARNVVVDTIWHPVLSTVTRGWRVASVKATVKTLLAKADHPQTDWEPWYLRMRHQPATLRAMRWRAQATPERDKAETDLTAAQDGLRRESG